MSDTLPPCDATIFANGKPLLAASDHYCGQTAFDAWIRSLAAASGQRIDWHYSGGVSHVLFVGDRAAIRAAAESGPPCPGRILRWFADDEPGLYRGGVTPMPPGAIAAWYEGGHGSTFA